jgi:hypothetical protein
MLNKALSLTKPSGFCFHTPCGGRDTEADINTCEVDVRGSVGSMGASIGSPTAVRSSQNIAASFSLLGDDLADNTTKSPAAPGTLASQADQDEDPELRMPPMRSLVIAMSCEF